MLSRRNPQLNRHGELIHLLSIEGLPRAVLHHILDTASTFLSVNDREVKKVPLLRGKSVFNLFFENSTRTRTTFEIAAKRLSADVLNLDIARSSASMEADERAMSRLSTSADSRLAAISKVVRVRVLFSKNRLNTLLPRSSGTFFTSRSLTERKVLAVSRM